jgi:hypothetical protein
MSYVKKNNKINKGESKNFYLVDENDFFQRLHSGVAGFEKFVQDHKVEKKPHKEQW